MFVYYNTVTRAMGNTKDKKSPKYGVASYGLFSGQKVLDVATGCPRFIHTMFAMATGINKLSFALPTREVYRGMADMQLPHVFRVEDKLGLGQILTKRMPS